MQYKDIQTIKQYKSVKQILFFAEKLKKSMEKNIIITEEQYKFYKTLKELITKYKIRNNELEKEVINRKILENITIEDLIEIEIYDE